LRSEKATDGDTLEMAGTRIRLWGIGAVLVGKVRDQAAGGIGKPTVWRQRLKLASTNIGVAFNMSSAFFFGGLRN
jgi:endonuclease YncB( thermonuclease family)